MVEDATTDVINGIVRAATAYRDIKGAAVMDNPDQIAGTITTIGLGTAGGILSTIFGKSSLSWVQTIGCVISGSVLAYICVPMVSVLWSNAPKQLDGVFGFFLGLIGHNIVKGVLAWGNRAERRVPDVIDKKLGTDTSEDKK